MQAKKIDGYKIFLIGIFAILMVGVCCALSGCGGDKAFEGSWKTSPADSEKLKNSGLLQNLGDVAGNEEASSYFKNAISDAFSMTITLDGGFDNKAKLEIAGMSQDGNWSSSSSTEGQITIGKTKASMSREGNKLTLSNGTVSINFYKQ